MKKNILIYGAGVIGSTFGGLIAKSGENVTILARNKRLQDLKEHGLVLQRIGQTISEKIDVTIVDAIDQDVIFDYVFVTLRNEQVNVALHDLSKINSSCFVFMVNNPSGYSKWIEVLGEDKVLPAFPGAGGNIINGVVNYEIVSPFIQPTTIGELSGKKTDRVVELKKIILKSGFSVAISNNMDVWQKTHVAMVAPLGAVIYYDGGNNYSVSKNKKAIHLMNKALVENFRFLKKSGIGIEPFKLNIIRFLPIPILNILMKYLYNTKWAEVVISNHTLNAVGEMDKISEDFLELAKQYGYNLSEFRKLLNKN